MKQEDMATEKYSFIKEVMGRNTYEQSKEYAEKYIPLATIVLLIVLALTYFFHWGILSFILNLIFGTSLIFLAYIIGVVLLLDFGVDVELEETWGGSYRLPKEKPKGYNNTIIWGVTLIILAIAAIYFSNRYRNHYAFECDTFLVDRQKGIYHLDGYNDGCEEIEEDSHLVRMKGYEAEKYNCTFCPSCEEWVEDAESDSY